MDWINAPLSRRSALRGAGAILALPFLESWCWRRAVLAGQSPPKSVKPPLRFGIYTVTGGTVLESWKCPQAGPLPAQLPSILRPLEPHRQQMLVLTGLSHHGNGENVNAHEYCAFKHLTGAPRVGKSGGRPFAGVSVDQVAARVLGAETFLPSLEFGLASHETRFSFRAMDELVPYETDPRRVFDRMFRGRTPVAPNWVRRSQAQAAATVQASSNRSYDPDRSVVDAVREEARQLRAQLGQADRQKLDGYLDAVRGVENRIERLEARIRIEAADLAHPGPAKLVQPQLPPANISNGAAINLLHRDPEKHAEYIRTMSDLWVLAFQTDTTRVATLALGSDDAHFPGVVTVGYETHCHTLEHQGNADKPENADPIAREACRQIHAWYTALFAETIHRMAQIDEGGSTLLDNTMLLYTSYMADGGHGNESYPALLLGGAQGQLRGGRQIDYPKRTPMSNLYVEMLARIGADANGFGDSLQSKHQQFGGRLPGLSG
jgi:hypothetical protein